MPLDTQSDYSNEPTTLVMFTLEDAGSGTMLTVVESGFDKIPAARRAKAFEMNSMGWARRWRTSPSTSPAKGAT